MNSRLLVRKYLIASVLALGGASAAGAGFLLQSRPAQAIPVFDSANYAQNLLTAARTLQQINQQIQSLQNEASMLTNMAKNLSRISFPELQQLTDKLRAVDQLMEQAQGIDFRIGNLDAQFRRLFPTDYDAALRMDVRLGNARERFDTAMAAFQQSMAVQSQVVGNVTQDAQTLEALSARSENAEGALQATQATNQLLALATKQQLQIQNMMAAHYRAEAVEQARRVQAEADARTATRQFLGSGSAYTPR
ncbi:P-type conjugative transfer protein TrbJ [Sphingobium chlorophenolicum]|uniref:Conjugal transfer protein TrbJ n=1 Tax=Sphingobium chlorophenolicum TaxID=46429 RepID=A0A081RCE2_SPHCR|nr:P-type conjugative transfer protein TrbJ [Sphingobium chlorophenolicum]KEQ52865.1 Conjugal transfer protein TrbJ [Sphingobium chlorophenolicum]